MSTRIDEIAMMANEQTGNKFDLNHKELDKFLKKFAELIVKECAELVEYNSKGAGRDIREHFGIEE